MPLGYFAKGISYFGVKFQVNRIGEQFMEVKFVSTKENKDKLAVVTQAVKHVMKFRPIWANFCKDGLRTGILLHCVSH